MAGRRGGARTTKPPPTLYEHTPHIAEVITFSADGCRGTATPAVVHIQPDISGIPFYYQEDAATNAALEAADFSYNLGDTSLPAEEQEYVPVTAGKKKEEQEFSARPPKKNAILTDLFTG
jgi:hypothetical protein